MSDVPESAVRVALGPAQDLFDALECYRTSRDLSAKLKQVARHLEFGFDRMLLVTANGEYIAAARDLGVPSAGASWLPQYAMPSLRERPAHVIAEMSELIDILFGRPTLRLVR